MSTTNIIMEEEKVLKCPACQDTSFGLIPFFGEQGEQFLNIQCRKCGEQFFFQMPTITTENEENSTEAEDQPLSPLKDVENEWHEWILWKKRHLNLHSKSSSTSNTKQWLLGLLLILILSFYALDKWHLLDPIIEDPVSRQEIILDYAYHLLEIQCIPSIMKVKIRSVPIRYTREQPVHGDLIKYGEAGIYWGEEQIKIHRSNFWFFGLPKKTQLINTLIHELRHRISPGLGHNQKFYELVDEDTQCALNYW